MRFLIDAQLPPALAGWIAERGHEAQHVSALGLEAASDQVVWSTALASRAVVITKDHDFVEWVMTRRPAPAIVWVRMGNVANPPLMRRLAAVWDAIMENLEAGVMVVEAGGR